MYVLTKIKSFKLRMEAPAILHINVNIGSPDLAEKYPSGQPAKILRLMYHGYQHSCHLGLGNENTVRAYLP